jgi:hypothetical protein
MEGGSGMRWLMFEGKEEKGESLRGERKHLTVSLGPNKLMYNVTKHI